MSVNMGPVCTGCNRPLMHGQYCEYCRSQGRSNPPIAWHIDRDDYNQAIVVQQAAKDDALQHLNTNLDPRERHFYQLRLASCEKAIALLKRHNNEHPPEP